MARVTIIERTQGGCYAAVVPDGQWGPHGRAAWDVGDTARPEGIRESARDIHDGFFGKDTDAVRATLFKIADEAETASVEVVL